MNTDRLISAEAAIQIAADMIREHAIRGMCPFEVTPGGCLNIEFKRARAVSCDLAVCITRGDRKPIQARRGEPTLYAYIQRPVIEVGWSSTARKVPAATAALALYREVTELAALIEARLLEEMIGWHEVPAAGTTTEVAR